MCHAKIAGDFFTVHFWSPKCRHSWRAKRKKKEGKTIHTHSNPARRKWCSDCYSSQPRCSPRETEVLNILPGVKIRSTRDPNHVLTRQRRAANWAAQELADSGWQNNDGWSLTLSRDEFIRVSGWENCVWVHKVETPFRKRKSVVLIGVNL